MSLLSDRIKNSLIDHRDGYGRYDLRAVVVEVKADLSSNEVSDLLDDVLYQRAKKAATHGKIGLDKAARKLARSREGEPDLFPNLQQAYALGEDIVKDTDALRQLEFARVISIREKQLQDDAESINELKVAKAAADPIWRDHPNWTFGQCKAELKRRAIGAA